MRLLESRKKISQKTPRSQRVTTDQVEDNAEILFQSHPSDRQKREMGHIDPKNSSREDESPGVEGNIDFEKKQP